MKPGILTSDAFANPWKLILMLSIFAYVFLVRILRYQRSKCLESKYAPTGRQSFRSMSADDAQVILKTIAELEFPSLYGLAMVMALFRVGSVHEYFRYSSMTNAEA